MKNAPAAVREGPVAGAFFHVIGVAFGRAEQAPATDGSCPAAEGQLCPAAVVRVVLIVFAGLCLVVWIGVIGITFLAGAIFQRVMLLGSFQTIDHFVTRLLLGHDISFRVLFLTAETATMLPRVT
jgi:hypothetical protein